MVGWVGYLFHQESPDIQGWKVALLLGYFNTKSFNRGMCGYREAFGNKNMPREYMEYME